MGRNVKVGMKELQEFQHQIAEFTDAYNVFIAELAKEIMQRLIRKVTQRTPTGEYPSGSGKSGGTLEKGWNGKIEVRKMIGIYEIKVTNPTEYADYVESGHRTRGGSGWVPGQFFLKISEEEIQAIAPALVKKKIEQKLREMMK